jgi:hypothetical protein
MKSEKLLQSFIKYCTENPELRFWQALRNWSQWGFILVSNDPCFDCKDTFYWEDEGEL